MFLGSPFMEGKEEEEKEEEEGKKKKQLRAATSCNLVVKVWP